MSEQVVVICSAGEQGSAIDLCSTLEEQGLTCWSPVREEDPDAAMWTLPSKLRSARAMVLVTSDASRHAEEVEAAAQSRLPVIVAAPGAQGGGWDGVLRELADALGLAADWISPRATSPGAQPKTHIAEDEEEFLEYIAENVSEAQVFVRFGLFSHAVGRLEKVFAKAPRNLEAHDELFKIHIEQEDWKKAAATAADFLDCLRYRGDSESYAILRTHLANMGFSVQDGPPVAVGYSDVDPVPTKFFDVKPVHPKEAQPPVPAAPATTPAPAVPSHEPIAFDLPALRNFKASQPVFQSNGVESELSGIDFFIDHGMLDEARRRIEQIHLENPNHPGVLERKARIEALGVSSPGIGLELDDPWEAAAKVGDMSDANVFFARDDEPGPVAAPANGPVGEGDSLICTTFVPENVEPGDMFVIRVCVHTTEQNDCPMLESHHDRRESNMLARNVAVEEGLAISLKLPGLELDGDRLHIAWKGEPDSVEFGAVVPFGHSTGTVTGTLSIHTESGPAGDFSIIIPVS